jgi:hypothetical protein
MNDTEYRALKRWTLPDNYGGAEWPDHFVFLGQHRDSDRLTRSNFRSALAAIGGESETVTVVRESHWAVGWVEWIAIHQDDETALSIADEIACALTDYPVVDDEDFSALEDEEAQETWQRCYRDRDRVAYIRRHRSQFEFSSFSGLLGCARGKYFCGYASELLA